MFQVPNDVAYFNVAGISPLLVSVIEAGQAAVAEKGRPWLIGADQFFTNLDRARGLFAKLVGANLEDIAIVSSATYGVETAVRNIQLKAGDEIVVVAEEFPALILPLQRLGRKTNAALITVPRPANFDWTSGVLKSINTRTRIVALGPCHWTDGTTVDLIEVSQKARAVGAELWIDGCQWLGARPFDVNVLKPDYLFAPTYKWLMGPYTFGFLYVSPRHQSGEPLEEYWASRQGAEDFAQLTHYNPQYQAGAKRFDMSERSQFINAPMASRALEQILAWGPQMISAELEKITDHIADEASAKGYVVAPKEFRSPHFLGIKNPQGFSENFKNTLVSQNIHVGYRGEWMRISPHLHNSQEDVEHLLAHL